MCPPVGFQGATTTDLRPEADPRDSGDTSELAPTHAFGQLRTPHAHRQPTEPGHTDELADHEADGHLDDRRLFERLLGRANDVGLLAEQYDRQARRLVGNFPQALSHIALADTARNLSRPGGPADERRQS